ncbi:MAG: M43 family zinc metalloprotease [Ginsengibacter sp.]
MIRIEMILKRIKIKQEDVSANSLKIILILFCLYVSANLLAQQPVPHLFGDSSDLFSRSISHICSNDVMLYQSRKDVAFRAREDKMNLDIQNAMRRMVNDTIYLPVVVHIINPNPASITDAQIINGIKLLNDAFSKSGIYSASPGADTKIRFCIATKDPDGGISTGITRTTSFFSTHLNMDNEDGRLKNLIQWDPSRYINIWLINNIDAEAYADFICGSWYRLGVGGYATMPPGGGSLDGIVVTGFGALLAHEMGHYLGLYHTFEGGCFNNNCLLNGDRVCDTPPDGTVRPSAGCGSPTNSCNTDTLSAHSNGNFIADVPDQIANFMDYGNGACSIEFTQGQADRMRAAIMSQRTGLLTDECTEPCGENITANFTRNIAYPVIGDLITFTNTSSGAANFQWLVNDVVVSTGTNFSYTFNVTGKNKVTLKAFNTIACFASYTDYVIVNCGVTARFYTNKKTIASKINVYTDSIMFTNASYNGVTYQWLISNDQGMTEQVISTGTNLTYVFPIPANYSVRLVAANGSCADTTEIYTVPVFDPTADGMPFSISLNCYQPDKVRINFCIADFGYAPLPVNTPVNFYDADPRLAGANKLSPAFYLTSAVPGGNCGVCFTHILNVNYHGLEKIYVVFNDSGNVVPVALPNTPLAEKNYLNNIQNSQPVQTTIFTAVCQGQNYAGHTVSGNYIDTFSSVINGCDSIRTLNLTVKPVAVATINASICQRQNYAGHTASGTYVDVYSAANGCDSTRTLNLTVKPVFNTSFTVSICQGQNYYGHIISGTYVDTYFAANGCDSTRTVFLTVKPIAATNITATICQGQNYAGHTASGAYVDTYFAVNGCDSIRTLQLTVNPTYNTSISVSICQGENYAGHVTTGIYTDVYSAANGCDSTRVLNLTVNLVRFTTVTTAICQGENYAGHVISGTYTDVYSTTFRCDSIRTLNLTVKPTFSTNITDTICQDDNYAGHTASGIYIDVYAAANGCDSTRTLKLTVKPKSFTVVDAEICSGESYLAGGRLQTTTGIYTDTLLNYLGCDSIITTNLTVNPLPTPDLGIDRGICIGDTLILTPGTFVSYLWQDGSTSSTYSTNVLGKYYVLVTTNFGCKASDTMKALRIDPLPANFLPADTSLCRGNVVHVNIPGYINYLWSTGSTSATVDIIKSGNYNLQVTDRNGCKGTDSLKILYYNCATVWIPNAFTPDADGLNDIFRPVFPAPVSNYRLQIWNRWGLRVFESLNSSIGWDGKFKSATQPSAIYIYIITFKDIDGMDIKKTGMVTLLK